MAGAITKAGMVTVIPAAAMVSWTSPVPPVMASQSTAAE